MDRTVIVEYLPEYGPELVQMLRDSFEQGVGVQTPYTFEDQLRFINEELVPNHSVVIVLDQEGGKIVGFLAATPDEVSQLYIHVDHQHQGIGSMLINIAKQNSNGRLRLFTFERNKNAQRFYAYHGFTIVARGFEEKLQLADIEYEWLNVR